MNRRALGITLLALGPIVLALALAANLVGLGAAGSISHLRFAAAATGLALTAGGATLRACA